MFPLIALGISVLGGALGQAFAASGRASQEQLLRQSMNEIGDIDLPKFKALVAEQLSPSALEGVKTDPRLTETQYQGLGDYDAIANGGGLDLAAQADLNRSMSKASRAGNVARNSIQADMDARGAGGSAASAVLQAKSAQDTAQQAHDSGLDTAGAAWGRRMEALGKRTGLAGSMRSQEYGEKAKAAEASDSIARQNADYRQSAARYNQSMQQQAYQNALAQAQAKAGVAGQLGGQKAQAGEQAGNMVAGLGNAAAGAVNAGAQQSQAADDRAWEAEQRRLDRESGISTRRGW